MNVSKSNLFDTFFSIRNIGENMITIVGSLNVDMNIDIPKFVTKGETIMGDQYTLSLGGKGGNQAVAAAKLGGTVQFIGAVGDDVYGQMYKEQLQIHRIDTSGIATIKDSKTGTAIVMLSQLDNAIIVLPGANEQLTVEHIYANENKFLQSSCIVVQFEIPHVVIEAVLQLAEKHGIPVIVNPAPYRPFPQEWLNKIAYITPNETEYARMQEDKLNIPAEKLILTLGGKGVSYSENGERQQLQPPAVDVVDTTGAGDTFNGALAVALYQLGHDLKGACTFAMTAASLSTTRATAQGGMPTLEQVVSKQKEGENEWYKKKDM